LIFGGEVALCTCDHVIVDVSSSVATPSAPVTTLSAAAPSPTEYTFRETDCFRNHKMCIETYTYSTGMTAALHVVVVVVVRRVVEEWMRLCLR
jgi:hypothetical protein